MKNIILILIVFISFQSFSQFSFEGIVIDENGEAIPFSNISLKNDSLVLGTTTDFDGRFVIQNITQGTYTYKVSYIGYNSQEMKAFVVNQNIYDTIQLSPSEQKVEEIMVIRQKRPFLMKSANIINLSVSGNRENIAIKPPLPDEAYIIENDKGFTLTSNENTSTFSIDVDNASYTHMRNTILKQNKIPDTSDIRLEEMINYFNYDYLEPKKDKIFSVYNELGECPWNNKAKLLHIGIQGKSIDYKNLDNSNLVFLIDVSGSMSNGLSLIKKSLNLLVDELGEKDKVSIVVYAGAAGLVLKSTNASEKDKIKKAINNLSAGGSTAGGAGINLAYKIAKQNFIKDGNNRVVLCTDGDFNVGVSSEENLIKLIEEKRKDKIFLTVCGFGYALHRDREMESLADKGNGNYYFIDNEKEAEKVFVKQMRGTLFTIAKDLKIQMVFDEEVVKSYRLIGYTNRKLNNEDFKNDKKDAGELGAGQTVTALYEVILREKATEADLAEIKLRFKKPSKTKSELLEYSIPNTLIADDKTSTNFKFSAAVTSFGLLLSKTNTKNKVSINEIIARAKGSVSKKDQENRKEFVKILEAYKVLDSK